MSFNLKDQRRQFVRSVASRFAAETTKSAATQSARIRHLPAQPTSEHCDRSATTSSAADANEQQHAKRPTDAAAREHGCSPGAAPTEQSAGCDGRPQFCARPKFQPSSSTTTATTTPWRAETNLLAGV